jgi:ferric enterobactin receptor
MFITKKLSRLLVATCALILSTGTIWAQNMNVTGKVTDKNGEPVIGAYVLIQGTSTGTSTDIDGAYLIPSAPANGSLVFSSLGFKEVVVAINNRTVVNVVLEEEALFLEEMVVTAFGIKKERKSLGYAVEDLGSNELMRNKTANPISSLSGKIAGVNITQSSGAAGSGAQIILRGGTSGSEGKDNQPLFVVDGVIYDNSSNLVGNSAFDGSYRAATTTSNRIMDMNPEDIENMSILKGPAASALYGSRAANGVVLITTKKGKDGVVEVNFNSKFTTSWAKSLPQVQTEFKRGYMEDQYDSSKAYTGTVFNDFSYNSWGERSNSTTYDNIGNFSRVVIFLMKA